MGLMYIVLTVLSRYFPFGFLDLWGIAYNRACSEAVMSAPYMKYVRMDL